MIREEADPVLYENGSVSSVVLCFIIVFFCMLLVCGVHG